MFRFEQPPSLGEMSCKVLLQHVLEAAAAIPCSQSNGRLGLNLLHHCMGAKMHSFLESPTISHETNLMEQRTNHFI